MIQFDQIIINLMIKEIATIMRIHIMCNKFKLI